MDGKGPSHIKQMKENEKLSINFYIIKTFSALTKTKSKKQINGIINKSGKGLR